VTKADTEIGWLQRFLRRTGQLCVIMARGRHMTSTAEIMKYQEENLLLKRQIEQQTGKTIVQLYAERAKRVRDAIELGNA
jgi:hypothetical protein